MRKFFAVFLILLFISASCGGDSGNTGDTGDTGNTGNTSDTGDLPGDSGDTGNTGSTGDTGNTGNSSDPDDDNDGIPNSVEGDGDTDNDGTPDYLDTDSDNDGINDNVETPNGVAVDTDMDGVPDYKDDDSDGDGVPDSVEGIEDADADGVPNYRDTDSDGDSITDQIECPVQPCFDSDEDSIYDYLDDDSDNDGIKDVYEGVDDPDKDGIPNFLDDDSDGDSISDKDENNGNNPPVDSDGDDIADFIDFDSDNDGLTDKKEVEIGTDPTLTDSDGDGFDDNTENAAGSDPTTSDPEWWDGKYAVVLPYNDADHELRTLDFSTKLSKVDILIIIDVSGSMQDEIDNLKQDLRNVVIPGINNISPGTSDYAGFGLMSFGNNKDLLRQPITTDNTIIDSAIQGLPNANGGSEPHSEALYQAAVGDGNASGHFPAVNCSGQEGNKGGGCYRDMALPIFLMLTDESFDDLSLVHNRTQAINAMNSEWLNAKFIGVATGTSSPNNDFKAVSQGTGSVDTNGNPFNYQIGGDGTGMSTQIINAVSELANNIQMEITTSTSKIEMPESHDDGLDSADFIKYVKPKSINSTPAINCPETDNCDDTKFFQVKAGIGVTFDIDFYNDFYEPDTTENVIFRATINVLGEGASLDSREVWIIVPGKEVTGPGN